MMMMMMMMCCFLVYRGSSNASDVVPTYLLWQDKAVCLSLTAKIMIQFFYESLSWPQRIKHLPPLSFLYFPKMVLGFFQENA